MDTRELRPGKRYFPMLPFDAIYSTDYNRTKLTAKPTATSKNLPILLVQSKHHVFRGISK